MFEYQILRANGFVTQDDLNKLGEQGWELVAIMPDEAGYDYIFKRYVRPLVHPVTNKRISPTDTQVTFNLPPTPEQLMEAFKNANPV